jgi:FAD/FMN-containing dehydrogenase
VNDAAPALIDVRSSLVPVATAPGERSVPSAHDRKVEAVCAQLRIAAALQQPVHIDKGGVHHFVPQRGDARFAGRSVDVSALNAVLAIDVEARLCIAEPGATFAEVVRRTLAHGLLPKVVPELEGITLGGATRPVLLALSAEVDRLVHGDSV